ncbi:MAG: DnaA/Hda family protein, partial [Lacipirellulaceae bacterium]
MNPEKEVSKPRKRDGTEVLSDVEQYEIQELDLGASAPAGDRLESRFVVDEQNQLLAALFESLLPAEHSSLPHCNPLTLVGPSGSGKSMLAQGLVRLWQSDSSQQTAPAEEVAYFTAADFGRELQALQEDSSDPSGLRTWRRSIRQVDLLVIEDLDQLRQRSTIQQELCRCLDAVVDRGGRVIVTASREPLSLTNLRGDGDALVDRLSAGLVLRLQSPGPAARRHLLRSIAENRSIELDEQQLTTLVNRSGSKPAAKLFGLLTEYDYDLQTTRHAETVASDVEQLSLKEITTVVCRYLGL